MTQQPYYPAGPQASYPGQPVVYTQPPAPAYQPPVQQPQYPAAPAQQYAPQAYPQQPPSPQGPPPAQGSLDAFYSQPTAASGPSIAWSVNGQQKPLGTSYTGIVARDVIDADVQQDSDPKTGQLKTYRDGRPRFFMKVPLKVQQSPEFPEGEATWYVRGQSRDELARAMAEAGVQGSPRGGDAIRITLVDRRPSRGGGMPANIVQVQYQPANGQVPAQQQAPAPQPVQQPQVQPEPQQYAPAPVPQQPQAPQQYAAPQAVPQQQVQAPVAPQQPAPVQPQEQAPVQQLQMPADFDPAQQALLARITGQGQPA